MKNRKQEVTKKVLKKGERGYVADNVAKLAEAFLKSSLTPVSLTDVYTAVNRQISKKKLDIDICLSRLKTILIAEKRKFSFVQVAGGSMHLIHENSTMFELLKSINDKMEEAANQRRAQVAELARSNVRYLHTAPRTSHEEVGVAKRA